MVSGGAARLRSLDGALIACQLLVPVCEKRLLIVARLFNGKEARPETLTVRQEMPQTSKDVGGPQLQPLKIDQELWYLLRVFLRDAVLKQVREEKSVQFEEISFRVVAETSALLARELCNRCGRSRFQFARWWKQIFGLNQWYSTWSRWITGGPPGISHGSEDFY